MQNCMFAPLPPYYKPPLLQFLTLISSLMWGQKAWKRHCLGLRLQGGFCHCLVTSWLCLFFSIFDLVQRKIANTLVLFLMNKMLSFKQWFSKTTAFSICAALLREKKIPCRSHIWMGKETVILFSCWNFLLEFSSLITSQWAHWN